MRRIEKLCWRVGMSSLTVEARASNIQLTDDFCRLTLVMDARSRCHLAWYPRLLHGSEAERNNWRFIGDKEGIHWPDLDEDISVENLLLGKPSAESQTSFKRWLEQRLPAES